MTIAEDEKRKRALLMLLGFLLLLAGWVWLRLDLLVGLLGLDGWSLFGGGSVVTAVATVCPINWNAPFGALLDGGALLASAGAVCPIDANAPFGALLGTSAICPIDPNAPFGALLGAPELAREAALLGIEPTGGAPIGAYVLMGVGGAMLLWLLHTGTARQRAALLTLLLLGSSRAATTGGRRTVPSRGSRRSWLPKKLVAAVGVGSLAALSVYAAVGPNGGSGGGQTAEEETGSSVRQPRGGMPQDEDVDPLGNPVEDIADDEGGTSPTQIADAGTGTGADGGSSGDETGGDDRSGGTTPPSFAGLSVGGEASGVTQGAGEAGSGDSGSGETGGGPGGGEMPSNVMPMIPMMPSDGGTGSEPANGGTDPSQPGSPGTPTNDENESGPSDIGGTPGTGGGEGSSDGTPPDLGPVPELSPIDVRGPIVEQPIIDDEEPLPSDPDPVVRGPEDEGDDETPDKPGDTPPTGAPGDRPDGVDPVTDVPEPGALGLLGLGVAVMAARRRRARK